ncbi:hypothetical protein TNIN_188121, partial [Trichonephila inaurata madagascariensis]
FIDNAVPEINSFLYADDLCCTVVFWVAPKLESTWKSDFGDWQAVAWKVTLRTRPAGYPPRSFTGFATLLRAGTALLRCSKVDIVQNKHLDLPLRLQPPRPLLLYATAGCFLVYLKERYNCASNFIADD